MDNQNSNNSDPSNFAQKHGKIIIVLMILQIAVAVATSYAMV